MTKTKTGHVHLITGPMSSGKTEFILHELSVAEVAIKNVPAEHRHNIRQHIIVVKPKIDTRSTKKIESRNGKNYPAVEISTEQEFWTLAQQKNAPLDDMIVVFEEAQFFAEWIVDLVKVLSDGGAMVYVIGLDLDFRGEPFGFMPQLLALADEVSKLKAICIICGRDAVRTQRLINGDPAHYDEPVILVGGDESYQARCREHHIVPKSGPIH